MELMRLKVKGIALLPSIAALVVAALTVSLGNWQTRRAEEKSLLQAARDQAALQPPVVLDARALDAPTALVGRRAIAEGRFLEEHSVFIDNRSYRGQAGFHVLTPFRLEGSSAVVLVLRGWVPSDPAARSRLPALAESQSSLQIEALVQRDLDQVLELMKAPAPGPGERLWQNASVDAVSRWSGLTLPPIVLRQIAEAGPQAATLVRDWPSPGAGVDKHRAYAFQWYSMAFLVICLWLIYFWRTRRSRS